jgi:tetratricopeptide (TPR) repeat protein
MTAKNPFRMRLALPRVLMPGAALLLLAAVAACKDDTANKTTASPPAMSGSAFGGYLAARYAQQVYDYTDAAAFIDKALAADPNNYNLVRRAFALRVSEGRVDEAAPLARRIVAKEGMGGLAGLVTVEQSLKRGDYAQAAKEAAEIPREGAQHFAVPLLLAWSDAGRGQAALAMKDLAPIGAIRGFEPLKDLHETLIEDVDGQTAKAAADYRKLIARQTPPTIRAAELAGNFYERHHDATAARAIYEQIAPLDDSDVARLGLERLKSGAVPAPEVASARDGAAEALFDLATLLNQRATYDASLIYARLALDLKPDFALGLLLAGELREQQDREADALAIYERIKRDSPFFWTGRLRMAMTLDTLSRTDEAKKQLEAMAAEQPSRPAPLIELGDIERGHSRFAAAASAYSRAIARIAHPGTEDWRVFYSRGISYERSGQWPRAEADLKRALALEPDQPLVLNYLGYTWIDKGQNVSEAMKMVQRAVDLRPDDGYIVDSLGWAYFRLGEYGRATETLERAIELLPEDPTINDHLGDAYWRTGRRVEARYQWKRALQFKPEADEIKTIEAKLEHGLGAPPEKVSGG